MELDRLIEAEQRNDELVRRATAEAAGIVRSATEAAARRRAEFADELQRTIDANAAALGAERARRMAEIEAAGREAVARIEAVSDEQVVAVARELVGVLVAGGPAP